MDFATPTPPVASASAVEGKDMLPNGHLMTPHDQRRRAALLADSPELSTRPPLNAGNSLDYKDLLLALSLYRGDKSLV